MKINRNNQKQLWADKEFIKKLEIIKAKRLLAGKPVNSLADLTREMMNADAFHKLEEELTNIEKYPGRIKVNIKFDGLFD